MPCPLIVIDELRGKGYKDGGDGDDELQLPTVKIGEWKYDKERDLAYYDTSEAASIVFNNAKFAENMKYISEARQVDTDLAADNRLITANIAACLKHHKMILRNMVEYVRKISDAKILFSVIDIVLEPDQFAKFCAQDINASIEITKIIASHLARTQYVRCDGKPSIQFQAAKIEKIEHDASPAELEMKQAEILQELVNMQIFISELLSAINSCL